MRVVPPLEEPSERNPGMGGLKSRNGLVTPRELIIGLKNMHIAGHL